MKKQFALLCLFCAVSCSVQNSAQMTNLNNENKRTITNSKLANSSENLPVSIENQGANTVKNSNSNTLDCNNPDSYSLEIVEDSSRNINETVTTPKMLKIAVGDDIKSAIKIPTGSEVKNFSVNSVEKNKDGFEITADWGGGNYFYEVKYSFLCNESNFYFNKFATDTFVENMDEPKKKEIQIKPPLPIEKFSILKYLGN